MTRRIAPALAGVAVASFASLAMPGTARACDGSSPDETRFSDAFATKDWEAAERAFERIVAASPACATHPIAYRYAVALAEQGKRGSARTALETLVAAQPDHGPALIQLALLVAHDDVQRAGDLLLRAASHGFPALAPVCQAKLPQLARLRGDPRWILRALTAVRDAPPLGTPARNPFAPPRVAAPAPVAVAPPGPPEEPRRPARVLRDDLEAGSTLLGAMRRARDEGRIEDGLARFAELRALVEGMRREELDDFHRSGEALLLAGQSLRDGLERLRTVRDLAIEVRGIVHDPRPFGVHRALVVTAAEPRGQVYGPGETLRDRDGGRIRGLTIVAIEVGWVRFKLDDVEFVQALRAR